MGRPVSGAVNSRALGLGVWGSRLRVPGFRASSRIAGFAVEGVHGFETVGLKEFRLFCYRQLSGLVFISLGCLETVS